MKLFPRTSDDLISLPYFVEIFFPHNSPRTDLHNAILSGANLRGADLTAADLRETILRHMQLDGASLHQRQLNRANLDATVSLTNVQFLTASIDPQTNLPSIEQLESPLTDRSEKMRTTGVDSQ